MGRLVGTQPAPIMETSHTAKFIHIEPIFNVQDTKALDFAILFNCFP